MESRRTKSLIQKCVLLGSAQRRRTELRVFIEKLPQATELQKNQLQVGWCNSAFQLWAMERVIYIFFKSSTLSLTALKQKLYLKRKKTTHDSDSLVSITYGFLLREAPVPNVTRELIGRKVRNYFIVTHQRMFNARDKKKKFAIFTQEFGRSRCRCRCASLRKSPLVLQSWSWVWSQPRCGASVWKVWPKLEGWFLTGQEKKNSQCCKRHVFH